MIFERFEDTVLSHYSYAVGCEGAGEVAIIDPRRDVDIYLDFAKEHDLRITQVLETHIHADFASGARELAGLTGAVHHASIYDAGEIFEVQFGHQDMRDGDVVHVGGQRIQAVHTPGHTPEHLSFLVFDENRSKTVPMLFLTGDFLFVGSLGRPDLLGEEAKLALANQLFDSVQRLADLPDGLEIHPAHGAGSMCGAGMSGRPTSTLGFERIANPYLRPDLSREDFVAEILGSVPPFPDYYRRMKQVNSDGAAILGDLPGIDTPMRADEVHALMRRGAVIIDLRDQLAFGGGHIPGAHGIGLKSLAMWASWTVPYDQPIVLVGDEGANYEQAARQLVRVGLDDVAGYLEGGLEAWIEAGYDTHELPQISPHELQDKLSAGEAITVVDVRGTDEYGTAHIPGAINLIAGELRQNAAKVPNGQRAVALVCQSGYRSTVAGAVLLQEGLSNVMNVTGGMNGWQHAGLPTEG
jgi:hydroxyacylglutathione hydrolase